MSSKTWGISDLDYENFSKNLCDVNAYPHTGKFNYHPLLVQKHMYICVTIYPAKLKFCKTFRTHKSAISHKMYGSMCGHT